MNKIAALVAAFVLALVPLVASASGDHLTSVTFAPAPGGKYAATDTLADGANSPLVGKVVHYALNVCATDGGGCGAWNYGTCTTNASGACSTSAVKAKTTDVMNMVTQSVDGSDYQYTTDPLSWVQFIVP